MIDPPPPPEAAGSSLLYSAEFYNAAKRRLKPKGILQAWCPAEADAATFQAAFRSLRESFPYVRCFQAVAKAGTHMLASMEPIEIRKGAELAPRLPPQAIEDLLEWSLFLTPTDCLDYILAQEMPTEKVLDTTSHIRITDDRPYNEYFLLRRAGILNPWK